MPTDQELLKLAGEATLPPGFQWGPDAMEQFNFGKERAVEAIREPLAALIERLQAAEGRVEELEEHLRRMKELFRFALLNTTPEIARDGMVFIEEAEAALVSQAGGKLP